MSKSPFLDDSVHSYLAARATPPDEVLLDLIAETRALGGESRMQIAPEQGAFLEILTGLMGAVRAIEVGTFTGYSAICIARGLAQGGRLLCCDVSEEWTSIARRYWKRAGLEDRIELQLGPAQETLSALPEEPAYDLAFVDADKAGYPAYFEAILPRLRVGGAILVDNVLWSGRVADPAASDEQTLAIRAFNDQVAADERVDHVMLPLSDGLTILRKRGA